MADLKIVVLLFFIFLINTIENECPKDTPIQTINGCENIYCTDIQFQNGECIISNSIVKKQWLNNIVFLEINSLIFNVINMPNNDIIFVLTDYYDYTPFIYGFKSSGEIYFNQEICSDIEFEFFHINVVGLNIENNFYPLVCDSWYCYIFDLENNYCHIEDFYVIINVAEDDIE